MAVRGGGLKLFSIKHGQHPYENFGRPKSLYERGSCLMRNNVRESPMVQENISYLSLSTLQQDLANQWTIEFTPKFGSVVFLCLQLGHSFEPV
jgi:hypothetical protein